MPRYRLVLEYMGTRYSGWQIQKNARTVQGEIAEAIHKVSGCTPAEFTGSGRTDAGVHALHQVAHLDLPKSLPAEKMRRELNEILPSDIHILKMETAPPRFHARHHAVARGYLYQVSTRRSAFGKKLIWWVREELDTVLMEHAAALFVGMKDCRSFTADDPEEKSTKVLIEKIALKKAGDLVLIRMEGSHFLWKMVRRIVGVLVEAGKGNLTAGQVSDFFGRPSGEPARIAAPASGLFLERVYYEGDERLSTLDPVLSVGHF